MAGADPDAVLALVQAQAQSREDLLSLTQGSVAAEVRSFTEWYDSAKITALAARLAKVARSGQKQTAASTDAYAVRTLALLTGKRPATSGPVPPASLRAGVPLESVYGRLADNYRYLEATRGLDVPASLLERPNADPLARLSPEEILDRIVTRAEVQTDDNLSLAFQGQWQADMAKAATTVIGYRRVLHPELAKGGSCGLCVAASDRQYRRAELLPIHGRCNCGVVPIIGDEDGTVRFDPGRALNEQDLALLYKKAGGTTAGAALKKTRFTVVTNGELGPRLVAAGQAYRGPGDVAA
jgi:hypothetical protein